MAETKDDDFVDVQEHLNSEDENDEEYQDALDDLVRKSEAQKDKRNEPFQGEVTTSCTMDALNEEVERLKMFETDDSTQDSKKENSEKMDTEKDFDAVKDSNKEFDADKALQDEEEESGEEEEDEDNAEALLEERKKREEALSEEEIMKLKAESQTLKEEGNTLFRNSELTDAIKSYTNALEKCPLQFTKDRSIMYSNRAACMMHLEDNTAGIEDCTKAIELNPNYLKALLRRAELYEKTEKLDEALADYQKVLEMDPRMQHAREACLRLPKQIEERNEKMKEEMMGKLKDLGNMILRPFGLSTENFKLQQDPNSGGYSVSFQQNPAPPRQPPEPTYFPPEDPLGGSTAETPSGGQSGQSDTDNISNTTTTETEKISENERTS